jgi:hypothetical protein
MVAHSIMKPRRTQQKLRATRAVVSGQECCAAATPESPVGVGPKSGDEAHLRETDRILEILREGGYLCELLNDKPNDRH